MDERHRHGALPKFSGSPETIKIQDFFEEFERYCITDDLRNEHWHLLLDAYIVKPAKTAYDLAILDPAANLHPDIPAGPAANAAPDVAARAEAAIYDAYRNRYLNRRAWLINTHHGEVEQDALKEEIPRMHQGLNEPPSLFYTRLQQAIEDAGYLQATVETIARNAFITALHPDILYQLNMHPRMNTIPMVTLADRIWKNLTGHAPLKTKSPHLEPPQPRVTKIQTRPTKAEPSFQDQMDELTKGFTTLTAHIMGQQRGYGRQYPQQTFGRQNQRQNQRRQPLPTQESRYR
jgi:hypothetical protein